MLLRTVRPDLTGNGLCHQDDRPLFLSSSVSVALNFSSAASRFRVATFPYLATAPRYPPHRQPHRNLWHCNRLCLTMPLTPPRARALRVP